MTVVAGSPLSGKSRLISHICALTVLPAGGLVVVIDLDGRFVEVVNDTIELHRALTFKDVDDDSIEKGDDRLAAGVLILRPDEEDGASALISCLLRLATAELFTDLVSIISDTSSNCRLSGKLSSGNISFDLLTFGDAHHSHAKNLLDECVLGVYIDGMAAPYYDLFSPSPKVMSWNQFSSRTLNCLQRISRVYGDIPTMVGITLFSPSGTAISPLRMSDKAWPMLVGADAYIFLQRKHSSERHQEDDDNDDEGESTLFDIAVGFITAGVEKKFTMRLSDARGVRFCD